MLKCSLALPPPPPSPSMSRFSWTAVVALLLAAPLVSGSSEGFLATRTQGAEDTAGSTAEVDAAVDEQNKMFAAEEAADAEDEQAEQAHGDSAADAEEGAEAPGDAEEEEEEGADEV